MKVKTQNTFSGQPHTDASGQDGASQSLQICDASPAVTKAYPATPASVGYRISVLPVTIRALTSFHTIRNMRSHLTDNGTLLNETDLFCVYSDLIPDLLEPGQYESTHL